MRRSICLNMIVKNESHVIRRSLASVKPVIDYWVIVDTGSSDGTQKIIREFLKDIPGELHERPWVDFAHNRNEALALAKNRGDYLLFIDADDTLVFAVFPPLTEDLYYVNWNVSNQMGQRIILVKSCLNWIWEGVVHERIRCLEECRGAFLEGVVLFAGQDGRRSSDVRQKYLSDVRALEEAFRKDTDNEHILFQLALCYELAEEYCLALQSYEKRALMGRNADEIFFSLFRIGYMREILNMPGEKILKSYSDAYQFRPNHPEPLYRIVRYFLRGKYYFLGYLAARFAVSAPLENVSIFPSFDWRNGLFYQLAECALAIGRKEEARNALERLLKVNTLTGSMRTNVENILMSL